MGPIPVLWAVINDPGLSTSRAMLLEGKSYDYKRGFRKGYVGTVNSSTLISRVVGWSTWLVVSLLAS